MKKSKVCQSSVFVNFAVIHIVLFFLLSFKRNLWLLAVVPATFNY